MLTSDNITYIDYLIEDGKNEITSAKNIYDTMFVQDLHKGEYYYKIPINDFFIKYRDELTTAVQTYEIDDRFFYRPKAASLRLYGTTELWLSLLRINNMESSADFYKPLIKAYNPDTLETLINIFLQREKKSL